MISKIAQNASRFGNRDHLLAGRFKRQPQESVQFLARSTQFNYSILISPKQREVPLPG